MGAPLSPGDRVRVREDFPPGHIRTPVYIRGKEGVVTKSFGAFPNPEQLAIGRALVLDPKLLILDEPTEGIQPNIVHEIGDVVLKLNREEGLTVLLVEQKLPFARRVASEVCILDKGRRVAAGAIQELSEEVVKAHLSV